MHFFLNFMPCLKLQSHNMVDAPEKTDAEAKNQKFFEEYNNIKPAIGSVIEDAIQSVVKALKHEFEGPLRGEVRLPHPFGGRKKEADPGVRWGVNGASSLDGQCDGNVVSFGAYAPKNAPASVYSENIGCLHAGVMPKVIPGQALYQKPSGGGGNSYLSQLHVTGKSLISEVTPVEQVAGVERVDGEWKVDVATLQMKGENGQFVEIKTLLPLNHIPGVPMRRVHKPRVLEDIDADYDITTDLFKSGEWEKKTRKYKRGEWAPCEIGFYMSFADCEDRVRELLCQKADTFELPKGMDLKPAIVGYLLKYYRWVKEKFVDGPEEKDEKVGYKPYEASDLGLVAPEFKKDEEGETTREEKAFLIAQNYIPKTGLVGAIMIIQAALGYDDNLLPFIPCSYLSPDSVGFVHREPNHPLAANNLDASYLRTMMHLIDESSKERYISFAELRAYVAYKELFNRAVENPLTAGVYYDFAWKAMVSKHSRSSAKNPLDDEFDPEDEVDEAEDDRTDQEKLIEFLNDIKMQDRLAIVYHELWRITSSARNRLQAAAYAVSGKVDVKEVKKVHARLRAAYKDRVLALTSYAANLSAKLHKIERDDSWEESKGDVKEMENNNMLRYMLTSILALGIYATRILIRPIERQKELVSVPLPTDAIVQRLAKSSKQTDSKFLSKLQDQVAMRSDSLFLDPAAYHDGVCRIKGMGLKLINVKTGQALGSESWSWKENKLTGKKELDLRGDAVKLAEEHMLGFDCDKQVLMLTQGDLQNPLVLPSLPSTQEQNEDMMRALHRHMSYIGKKDGVYAPVSKAAISKIVGPELASSFASKRTKGRYAAEKHMQDEVEFSD